MSTIPEKPGLEGLESKWDARWEADGVYRFDRSLPRERVYSIDTPPPTVSGSLHLGHVFSYTQADFIARFQRLRGKTVFYPIGWDDNGLPTERRVQHHFGVRCDPALPYDPDFDPVRTRSEAVLAISRPNFIELCRRLSAEDERDFEAVWRRVGLSVDWALTYATNGDRARQISQRAFLDLLARGLVYRTEAPVVWDVDLQTAVAQAELEDREIEGAAYRLRFSRLGAGDDVVVETTRPELLPACVAVVAHSGDQRYAELVGTEVLTPVFGVSVPVLAHPLADPNKGTGLVMVCTFGDPTDVEWWRDLGLPLRPVVGADGTIEPVPWGGPDRPSVDPGRAGRAHDSLRGRSMEEARRRVVELLRDAGALQGPPRRLRHAVKFYEYGRRPVEILATRQWFVRSMDLRDDLLARGRELEWHPPHMRARFEAWVAGLRSDWCISRQRFLGPPFPVWYPVAGDGRTTHDRPIPAAHGDLPVDPATQVPPGYREDQRGLPNGFVADPDVMDTWATSSLSPHIAGGWSMDDDLFRRVFPMDLRPQAHEIIRTWLFTTMLRSHVMHDALPWRRAAISGWVLDSERAKMSKSKGTAETPTSVLDRHGSDAVRYWAARGRLGVDAVFDEAVVRVGRRLALKLLNATRFVLGLDDSGSGPIAEPVDRSMLGDLAGVVRSTSGAMESYEHARALDAAEASFWRFCDDYLELVKQRAYGSRGKEGQVSAVRSLRLALSVYTRIFAPFLPFVTEEAWSWWRSGSVHASSWPDGELAGFGDDGAVYAVASWALAELRRARATANVAPSRAVDRTTLVADPLRLGLVRSVIKDLQDAARIGTLTVVVGPRAGATVKAGP
jgi:valyl-tRNA synthetase